MKFTERYPNWCDFGPPHVYEVTSPEELIALPRIMDFVWKSDLTPNPEFYRLSIDYNEKPWGMPNRHALLAEMKEGHEWWVIGWLDGPLEDWCKALPQWEPKRKEAS